MKGFKLCVEEPTLKGTDDCKTHTKLNYWPELSFAVV